MKSSTSVLLTILLIVVIGAGIYFIFLANPSTKDKPTDPIVENGTQNGLSNGTTPPANGQQVDTELKSNYLITTEDPLMEGLTTFKMDKVNDSYYDFEKIETLIATTESELNENMMYAMFSIMFIPPLYAATLNSDFCEAVYYGLVLSGASIKDTFSIYDSDLLEDIDDDINFEQYHQLMKAVFIEQLSDTDLIEETPEIEELISVFTKMFELDIEMRNITITIKTIFENPETEETTTYVIGEFKYLGDEKKLYNNICNIEGECMNIYGEDQEWTTLDDFTNMYQNIG